jgi:hypothetical protein
MATSVHTWARLRGPIGNGYPVATGGPTLNNVDYASPQFVSASDQGPLRTYVNKFDGFTAGPGYPVFDYAVTAGGYYGFGMQPIAYRLLPDDSVNELIGETVTLTPILDTFVMDAQAFTQDGQYYALTPTPITAIGKLTIV